MKKEIDIGVHIRNELTEYGVEDSKIAEIVKIIEREDELAPVTVRLWCAATRETSKPFFKRGEIINFADGVMTYTNGIKSMIYPSLEAYRVDHSPYAKYLFPLLHRPAKEGEWVLIINDNHAKAHTPNTHIGDVLHVQKTDTSTIPTCTTKGQWLMLSEYDVIENYHGEYETCPTCGKMGEK